MSRRSPRFVLGVVSTAALSTLVACSGPDEEAEVGKPVSPVSVALSPDGVPEELAVGVVVSLTSAPRQGAQWNEAAEGAQVAAFRYGLGDVDVSILARNDRGTAKGAEEAVQELADKGVAGIVLATEGDHIAGAVDAASELGVPMLLPYADTRSEIPDGVWTTGPTVEEVSSVVASSLGAAGVSRPALVDAGAGVALPSPTVTVRLSASSDVNGVASRIAREARGDSAVDSVVISGPSQLQAQVVQALQARDVPVPVFLSGDAVSPVFADTLSRAGGSLTSALTTAGIDSDDVAALDAGDHGAAVSAYLAALRATVEDGEVTDFFDDEPFETVAAAADVRSHDAVVALVSAAAEAQSTDPAEVRDALASLTLDHEAGLAGPGLDFSSASALPPETVVPLQATTQDPGLRPVSTEETPRLYWFESPTG